MIHYSKSDTMLLIKEKIDKGQSFSLACLFDIQKKIYSRFTCFTSPLRFLSGGVDTVCP